MFNEEVESDEEQDDVEEEPEGQDDAEEGEDPEVDDIFSKNNNEGEDEPDDSFRFNQHE